MAGIRDHYEVFAVADGCLQMRKYGCWCKSCMHVAAQGQDADLPTPMEAIGCSYSRAVNCTWHARDVRQLDAAGVAKGHAAAKQLSQELLSKGIKPGGWLGIQARTVDNDGDNYWIVKAVDAVSTSAIYIAHTYHILN